MKLRHQHARTRAYAKYTLIYVFAIFGIDSLTLVDFKGFKNFPLFSLFLSSYFL